jgi:hypothetical protein
MAVIHPSNVPGSVKAILPGLPSQVSRAEIESMLNLRLPNFNVGVIETTPQ